MLQNRNLYVQGLKESDFLPNILKDYIKKFEDPKEDDATYFKAVQQTFNDHPKNIKKMDVALKFAVLNQTALI